jgi:hypothetical protein
MSNFSLLFCVLLQQFVSPSDKIASSAASIESTATSIDSLAPTVYQVIALEDISWPRCGIMFIQGVIKCSKIDDSTVLFVRVPCPGDFLGHVQVGQRFTFETSRVVAAYDTIDAFLNHVAEVQQR